MPGENILVVDDSIAVQELCRNVLEGQGYRVTVASNGVAAISYPDLPDVDLLIIDKELRGVSGLDTTRAMKTDPELHRKPVLLLVPEEEPALERESQNLYGGNAWLKKPFEPNVLVNKVQVLLEEREILHKGREFLRAAAENLMHNLAEKQIQEAVDKRTQIIVERALQAVITQVDQRARKEVDAKVTALSADKEQELVKMTVQEVARSLVEKIAEKKVGEAMESILREETEKSIRRASESMLPGLVRDRIRENLEQMLPKEIERRVQTQVEAMIPDISQKLIGVIESAAQKVVQKSARDVLAEVTERQVENAIDTKFPQNVQLLVGSELEKQIRMKVDPLVRETSRRIGGRLWVLTLIALIVCGVMILFLVADRRFDLLGKIPGMGPARPASTAPPPGQSTTGFSGFLDKLRQLPPSPTPAP